MTLPGAHGLVLVHVVLLAAGGAAGHREGAQDGAVLHLGQVGPVGVDGHAVAEGEVERQTHVPEGAGVGVLLEAGEVQAVGGAVVGAQEPPLEGLGQVGDVAWCAWPGTCTCSPA